MFETIATQVYAHMIGDYAFQSGWMANNKTRRSIPAFAHALTYGLVFFAILSLSHQPPSLTAMIVIVGTHFGIDRWRLARFVAFAKEFLAPVRAWPLWHDHADTGYHKNTPPFLAVWLMIIIDNMLHISINAIALVYL